MIAGRQFSLRSLFVATAFLAAACAVVRLGVSGARPDGQGFALLLVPVLLSGAIGALRGRVIEWLGFSAVIVSCSFTVVMGLAAIVVRLR